jgi:hypothetical protein
MPELMKAIKVEHGVSPANTPAQRTCAVIGLVSLRGCFRGGAQAERLRRTAGHTVRRLSSRPGRDGRRQATRWSCGRAHASAIEFAHAIRGKGGRLIAISDSKEFMALADMGIRVPEAPEWLSPLLTVVPGQLLALYLLARRASTSTGRGGSPR